LRFQVCSFFFVQPKRKIGWKTVCVAFDCLIQDRYAGPILSLLREVINENPRKSLPFGTGLGKL